MSSYQGELEGVMAFHPYGVTSGLLEYNFPNDQMDHDAAFARACWTQAFASCSPPARAPTPAPSSSLFGIVLRGRRSIVAYLCISSRVKVERGKLRNSLTKGAGRNGEDGSTDGTSLCFSHPKPYAGSFLDRDKASGPPAESGSSAQPALEASQRDAVILCLVVEVPALQRARLAVRILGQELQARLLRAREQPRDKAKGRGADGNEQQCWIREIDSDG